MARRSQCSSAGDNPLDPNYLPPHYREEYRLAVDALVEDDLDGYYQFLLKADVVDFLSVSEIEYIQGSVRVPQLREQPEHCYLEGGDDGSSDTYWPLHSDLDAPGLDLGWPQIHHFIGPTEVTTLVNPPEPNMPSIKEQARRLIKNAHQVVAIAMDMFTDVDIFADIVGAAMRNVAVYILLDKENVHHFINMVSNCRVDLQSLQFLRVRTVSGITYHCRSGKSFKGQMMDRFLLTDCRAVLSGNYSFMWSFEKLHRCMAHLFLGQLVSTFDEEFRILFAQSEPLTIENTLPPVEDFNPLQKRRYSSERPLIYREPRKFLSLDTPHPDEWVRHSQDDRTDLDWRMAPLKRPEVLYGPADVYSRFPSQQSRLDPSFDQGPSRMQMMENPSFKRHSYAEGGHGRFSYPFMQRQGMQESENQGRQFHRGQQPYPGPGRDADYSQDRFWSHDFGASDQYSEPGLPPELEPHDNFDPVLNYLSSTRNTNFDQGSEKTPPAADLLFSSSQPRRLSVGQPYVCQTSPTPSNPSDQKHFFSETNPNRKDPSVKRGLRNWRISSFLSAYDNPEDEGLPSTPPNAPEPFDDPSDPIHQTAPGPDLSVAKIPNVREFKIPALPRASQMPSYAKTTAREQPKKPAEIPTPESRSTPTPSESSSTTEGEKMEEVESKEPKTIQREESFRRKYNAAVQRTSRLRSSLIFSSLDQQHPAQDSKTAPSPQEEEGEKSESEHKKPPYVSQVFGQRRLTPREPFEWSRYVKSSLGTDSPKADSEKDEQSEDISDIKGSTKPPPVEQLNTSASQPQSSCPEVIIDPPVPLGPPVSLVPPGPQHKPLPSAPVHVDMSDPDMRLMFFKELAAKRKAQKAAEAAEAEKNKDKVSVKPAAEDTNRETVKEKGDFPKDTSDTTTDPSTPYHFSDNKPAAEDAGKTQSTESPKSVGQGSDLQVQPNLEDSSEKPALNSKDTETRASNDSSNKLKSSQSVAPMHVSAETPVPEAPEPEAPEKPELSSPPESQKSPSHPSTPTSAAPVKGPAVAHSTDDSESFYPDSPCQDPHPPSLSVGTLSSSEQYARPVQSCSGLIPIDSGSLNRPSHSPSTPTPLLFPAQTMSADLPSEDSSSLFMSGSSDHAQSEKGNLPISQSQSESTPHPVSPLTLSDTAPAVSSTVQSDVCPESDTSSLQSPKEAETEASPSIGLPLLDSCLPHEPDPKSQPVQTETMHLSSTTEAPQTDPDLTPKTSLPQTAESTDFSIETTPASDLQLTRPGDTGPGSHPETPSVSTSEAEQTGSPSDYFCPDNSPTADPNQAPTLIETLKLTEPETDPSVPDENTHMDSQSEVSTESGLPDPLEKELEGKEVTDQSTIDVCSEKTCERLEMGSDGAVPPSLQSRKSSQSRYLSSTANVLSSSNLRDDTKLLLEQISANNQNRNEVAKECAFTDDEKEDEADKNAKKDKERGIRLGRGPPKSSQERDKVLEKIQSMRKERRVYSRFEMAP
ncbi:protein FAM83H [Halichoeres trimaculatus]|uniref:protein FAM83H n=1 Tax=Halichoeres trimaculatus TaxID=147232 RepID=UPI003D9EEF6E